MWHTFRNTWLHPRHIATVYIRSLLAEASVYASGVMIDLGCGFCPYKPLFQGRITDHIGVDVPVDRSRAGADIIGDAQLLPLRANCADTVLATELIEHLPNTDAFLTEISRVLRPSGILILSAPFLEPLHEEPRDFFRFTPHGLRTVLERNGFGVLKISKRGGWWAVVIGSFVSQAIYDWANPLDASAARRRTLRGIVVLPVCAIAQLAAYLVDQLFVSSRYTLGYVVIATQLKTDERELR